MALFKKKKKDEEPDFSYEAYPFLKKFKPKEKYVFCSDYFKVDKQYGCIMAFFHQQGARDDFAPFWGINRIPTGLGDGVTTINFEQVQRMGEDWIRSHQNTAEGVAQMNENSQYETGTQTSKRKASRSQEDLAQIAMELNDGASYLNVHNRILVKANTLVELDDAVQKIERLYQDRFATLSAAPYTGEQRQELGSIFLRNAKKRGKGFYYTSTEYAGSYSLVTHGLEDDMGEYVGYMFGDVNNSAVLLDVDNYRQRVVVASEQYRLRNDERLRVSDMWGSKISQAALLDNHKVVHIVLDGCDLDKLGPSFDSITYNINMNHGDVNMFEMFGETEDELAIFAAHINKIVLMAQQIYENTDYDRGVIKGVLEDVLNKFYVDNKMWFENAEQNRDRIRVVNLPHDEVPKLEAFVTYLDMEYKAEKARTGKDDHKLHALYVLSSSFKSLLTQNGDLFNTTTSDSIDGIKEGRRVVYNFSDIEKRSPEIATAQLVNIIGFAVQNLGRYDTIIFHGAEKVAESVRDYVNRQVNNLLDKGGRVVYLYNSLETMLDDQDFNKFDKADYTIFGTMTDNIVNRYQKQLGQDIPPDLQNLVTNKDNGICYIRRGFDNVVFYLDLQLYPNKPKKAKKKFVLGRRA